MSPSKNSVTLRAKSEDAQMKVGALEPEGVEIPRICFVLGPDRIYWPRIPGLLSIEPRLARLDIASRGLDVVVATYKTDRI